jgi:hypothetical protein
MKFVQNNKILVDSNAENAEISAEKAQLALASLRLALRSLRLCVEIVFLFGSGFAGLGSGRFSAARPGRI